VVALMAFSDRLDFGYGSGRAATSLVPAMFDVAIAGRVFMRDTTVDPSMNNHQSIQYLTKFLTSPVFGSPTSISEVGESSLNPDVNWRRSSAAWHGGAGQRHFDIKDSDRSRFNTSKGIDCWTVGQISLLPDTARKRASANTNLRLVTAGDYLYVADGAALVHTTDLATFTDSGVSTTVNALASDGHTVWAALAAGVYATVRGSTSSALSNDLVPDVLGYAKDRLMAGKGPALYNITTGYLPGPPTGLALTVNGTAGTTHYAYRVSALNAAGETLACAEVVTTTGNATLTAANSVTLNWNAVTGATSYKVYGRTAGSELFIDSTSATTYTDGGTVVTPSGALPASDTTGRAPTALFTHPNSDWAWVGFASGDSCVYAAGWAGDYSSIYRVPLKTDGTGLDAPIQAGELPRGETALCVLNYLGLVFLGTSKGLRLATQASSGELQIGSVIETAPVRCLTGDGRFVWFGWDNYDTTSTGLGRADMTTINTDAPAYATDLMAAAQGHVLSVVSLGGKRVFAVSGDGIYQESADLVASGQLDSGLITFDLPDPKVAQAVDVRHSTPIAGSISVSLAVNDGTPSLLGKHTASSPDSAFTCRDTKGDVFELRVTLTRSDTDSTSGPTVSRYTLMAIPAALSGEQIMVPLLIREKLQPALGSAVSRDVGDDVAFLTGLRKSKKSFIYQAGTVNYRCTMADWQFFPTTLTANRDNGFEGTFVAQLLHQEVN
jgi:hypothetical protein